MNQTHRPSGKRKKETEHMDFTELTAYLDSIPALGVPGCDMAIYQDHKQVYRHSAGYRDAAKTQPVRTGRRFARRNGR